MSGGDFGIDTNDAGSAKNVVVRNTVMDQASAATAYAVDGDDSIGPIGTPATATSPWANFAIL